MTDEQEHWVSVEELECDDFNGDELSGMKVDRAKQRFLDSIGKVSMHVLPVPDSLQNVRNIGIFLLHRYTMGGITPDMLKGADRVLYEAVSNDFRVELLPVVWHKGYQWGVDYGISDAKDVSQKKVYSFTAEDLRYLNGVGPKPAARKRVPFVFHTVGQIIQSREQDFIEHTGNESQPGEVEKLYFHAAAILTRINKQLGTKK